MTSHIPCEYICHLEGSQIKNLILILDASESAIAQRGDIIHLCRGLLAELPADFRVQIYFLGNPQAYPAHQWNSQAPAWFQENAPRASLLGPILESLPPDEEATLVIVGNGLIYDLEDWRDSSFWNRLRLVHFGASLQSAGGGLVELNSPPLANLVRHLHDPVSVVELSGRGFLPLLWDNAAYQRVEIPGAGFILRAENPPAAALTLRCLLCQDAFLQLVRRHATGRVGQNELPLRPAPPRLADGRLTPNEVIIFDAARQHRDFSCPQCGETHAWDTLHCRSARALLAQPIFVSLRNQRGFVRLCLNAQGAEYRLDGEALLLGNGLAAFREGTHACLVRFDPTRAGWLPEAGGFSPYQPLGENCYGLFL